MPPTNIAEQGGAEVERRLQEGLHIVLLSIRQHSQHLSSQAMGGDGQAFGVVANAVVE